jgi:peptidoglycan/LPS O-acetylase OafA/YrhL
MQQDNASHWAILGMLRFLLATIVVATHLVWFIPAVPDWLQFAWELDGKAAVIGFLLVSGYSIHASLSMREDGFIKRRFLRVYPLYFTAVAMTIALEIWQGGEVSAPHHHFQTEGTIAAIGNLLLLQMFLVKTIAFNGPLWSISIEFFYYLCAAKIRKYGFLAGAVVALSLICFVLPRRDDLGLAYTLLTKLTVLTLDHRIFSLVQEVCAGDVCAYCGRICSGFFSLLHLRTVRIAYLFDLYSHHSRISTREASGQDVKSFQLFR